MKKKIIFTAVVMLLACVIPVCVSAASSDICGTEILSIEELQNEYDFKYFDSVYSAVTAINDGTVVESENVLPEDASVGVYVDENGLACVVLLEDVTENVRIAPAVDMRINLGGHTLSFTDAIALYITSGNITIDGTIEGSGICVEYEGTATTRVILATGSSVVKVLGGTYICRVYSNTACAAFQLNDCSELLISDAVIEAYAQDSLSIGVYLGTQDVTSTISNCDIRAYSNYTSNYSAASQGISNYGTLTLNNSYVMGTHSGVSSFGLLYVNGGTYESYGHGGIYLCGSNTTSYLQNAIIRDCEMPDGYTTNDAGNDAGIYIGGTNKENIQVYIDSCIIQGSAGQTFVLRGTSGEKNNTAYISNSTITGKSAKFIRIDNDTLKLYNGTGNNFTAEHTNHTSSVINTYETYVPGEPLNVPVLSMEGNSLIILSSDLDTEYYDVYVDNAKVGTVASQGASTEYLVPELSDGEYVIGVIARADGIKNSDMVTIDYVVSRGSEIFYTAEEIEASPYLYAIGNTGLGVVAEFNADYSKVTILKNSAGSDRLMIDWDEDTYGTTNPMYTNRDTLTCVVIDDEVSNIGNYAFYQCDSLENIYYSGTQQQWNDVIIGTNNQSLLDATIHYSHPMILATKREDDSGTKYIVEVKNIPVSSTVVAALYQNDRFVGMIPGTYNGETVELPTSIAHDEAKIVVFNNFNDISPLAEAFEFTNK